MRITPEHIDKLNENEIFVFGSNLHGKHHGGAAFFARRYFGAIYGQGVGLQGQSYAIPTTMRRGLIKPYVAGFIEFASQHPELNFLVTPVGCGIAGYTPDEVAPLFRTCLNMENVWLPQSFIEVLEKTHEKQVV